MAEEPNSVIPELGGTRTQRSELLREIGGVLGDTWKGKASSAVPLLSGQTVSEVAAAVGPDSLHMAEGVLRFGWAKGARCFHVEWQPHDGGRRGRRVYTVESIATPWSKCPEPIQDIAFPKILDVLKSIAGDGSGGNEVAKHITAQVARYEKAVRKWHAAAPHAE